MTDKLYDLKSIIYFKLYYIIITTAYLYIKTINFIAKCIEKTEKKGNTFDHILFHCLSGIECISVYIAVSQRRGIIHILLKMHYCPFRKRVLNFESMKHKV